MDRLSINRSMRLITALGLSLLILLVAGGVLAAAEDVRLDLFIELKAPEHVEPGGEYTVNLSYGNSNTAMTPEDAWVEATLPEGVQFLSALDKYDNPLPPDSVVGDVLHWDVGSAVPEWETQHIYIQLAVDEELSQNTSLTVMAEIGSSAAETDYDNNYASVTSVTCDMAGSTKQAHAYNVMPLDVITYTINIRLSQGSREVTLVDTLPPAEQARFLGWVSEETGTYNGNTLRWQGRVQAGQAVQLQYRMGVEGDVPPDTALVNQARLHWWDTESQAEREFELAPVIVNVSMSDDAYMIGPEGGQWQHSYGITLTVPAHAVQSLTRFQFKPLFDDAPPEPGPPGWFFAHRAFEMNAFQFGEIHQFNKPLEIAVQYSDQDVAGLVRNTLRLWYRNGPNSPWEIADEAVRHQDGLIVFETDHFTEFALFARGGYQVHLPMVMQK